MHNRKVPQDSISKKYHNTNNQIEALLREARALHQAVKTRTTCQALPVLKQIQTTGVCHETCLSTPLKKRQTLPRKQSLRMLTLKPEYPSSESCNPLLVTMPDQPPANLHNGRVLKQTQQAVVILNQQGTLS